MSNHEYVRQLGVATIGHWVAERLASDLDKRDARIAQLIAERDALQSRLDWVMLEYCPEEMTNEQFEEWARHQKPVTVKTAAEIRAALRQGSEL